MSTGTKPMVDHIPFRDYCAIDRVNFSRLKLMDWSPAHYRAQTIRDTPSLSIGRLIHLAVLEPAKFAESVVVWEGGMTKGPKPRPTTNKNSDAYKEFCREQSAAGREVVDQSDIDTCRAVARAVREHPVAAKYLSQGQAELSISWTHPLGLECKSRLDWAGPAIVDLKTTADIRPDKFNRSILTYSYHAQAAMYQDAYEIAYGIKRPYVILAAEKVAPFDVVPYIIDDAILDLGRQTYTRWMRYLLRCIEHDSWPGICTTEMKAELPQWAYDDLDDGKVYIDGMEIAV